MVLRAPVRETTSWRSSAAVLAFGTFAVGTDAFVIAGVLPYISSSLQVSVAAAGQLVTVFALAYALAAPLLGVLTAQWCRRTTLVAALTVFTLGNAVTALAPDYSLVLASRVIAAAGAALYTASASAAAATLAGEAHRGRAIAVVMLGTTSSLVLGTPVGTAIGSVLGWRSTLWFVTLLGILAAIAITGWIPAIATAPSPGGLRARLGLLGDARILGLLVRTFVVFTGIYIPYTYFSSVYETATNHDGNRLAILLLVFGVAATAGNLAAGTLADRFGPRRVIVTATLGVSATFLFVPVLRESMPTALGVVLLSGVLCFGVTTPQQQQIITLAPAARSVATSLYQSVLYLAISFSGVLGGVGLDTLGAAWLAPFAAGFVLLAAALSWASGRPAVRTRARP